MEFKSIYAQAIFHQKRYISCLLALYLDNPKLAATTFNLPLIDIEKISDVNNQVMSSLLDRYYFLKPIKVNGTSLLLTCCEKILFHNTSSALFKTIPFKDEIHSDEYPPLLNEYQLLAAQTSCLHILFDNCKTLFFVSQFCRFNKRNELAICNLVESNTSNYLFKLNKPLFNIDKVLFQILCGLITVDEFEAEKQIWRMLNKEFAKV